MKCRKDLVMHVTDLVICVQLKKIQKFIWIHFIPIFFTFI